MSSTSSLVPNLFLHFPHSKLCDQHFIFLWTFNSLILSKLLLYIYVENLLTAPIRLMWLFKPPLSKHSFPHLSHGKHIVACVLSPYDYSNHPCQSTHFHIYHTGNILLHMFSLHMIIQNPLVKAPISTFTTRKTYCCTCSLFIWLFKSPLSMHPFPHLIHGNHPIAYVHSSCDYSLHTPLEVCSTFITTKFYTDVNDDLRRQLM